MLWFVTLRSKKLVEHLIRMPPSLLTVIYSLHVQLQGYLEAEPENAGVYFLSGLQTPWVPPGGTRGRGDGEAYLDLFLQPTCRFQNTGGVFFTAENIWKEVKDNVFLEVTATTVVTISATKL